MSLPTIHISITFDTTKPTTIGLDVLQSKLNWLNLITLIESMHPIETPIRLYYKKQDEEIECLENQEQLDQLLLTTSSDTIKGLRFYSQKEQVLETVYVFPGDDAFARLGQFVNQNKSVIATSHRLARSVGLLATFIAQDTTNGTFDFEFQALERLVERKLIKSMCRERRKGKRSEIDEEQEETQDPRELFFGRGGGGGGQSFGRYGGRGGHFGGRRGGGHFEGRGGGHFGGRGAHGGGGPSFGGGRGRHHHGGHPFRGMQLNNDNSREEWMNVFGKREMFGRHGGYGFDGCPTREFGMHAKGFHGPFGRRHGGGGGNLFGRGHFGKGGCGKKKFGHSSSSEESSGEEEARAMHLLKKQHKRDFKRHANYFHSA